LTNAARRINFWWAFVNFNAIGNRQLLWGIMAVNYTKPPATAAITPLRLSRIPSFHLLNSTIAALVWVPLICVGSHAVGNTKGTLKPNPFSLTRLVISADLQDPDYTSDYVRQKQAGLDRAEISSARLVLYYEMLMLFFAFVIAIGALLCRGQADGRVDVFDPRSKDGRRPLVPCASEKVLR
jgi:hypothetical protein